MEIYFVDDKPRILARQRRYVAFRQNIESYTYNGVEFWTGDAVSYAEALESAKNRSEYYAQKAANLRADDKLLIDATHDYLLKIIDSERGDAFTLFMTPFEEWQHVLREDAYTIPEIYKK